MAPICLSLLDKSNSSRFSRWALDNARYTILPYFETKKRARYEAHAQYLRTLPNYELYYRHRGQPALPASELSFLRSQLEHADWNLKAGVDLDWRNACMLYPDGLQYFFNLVEVKLPQEWDERVRHPRIGGRKVKRLW